MSAPGGIASASGRVRGALFFAVGALVMMIFALIAIGVYRGQILAYTSDSVYANIALARNLLEQGFHGCGTERLPAHRDSLWRVALAAAMRLGASPMAAPALCALLVSLMGLLAIISLVRAVYPNSAWAAWACLAWGLMLPVVTDALSGSSAMFAASLATFGVAAHARRISQQRTALPLSSAFWIGLAALFRVEMLALWIALGLHTLVISLLRLIPMGAATALIRTVNGGLVAAILLCPVLWWNMETIAVPWPAAPDAAASLNSLVGASVGVAFAPSLSQAASVVTGVGVWGGRIIAIFVVCGIAWLLADLARRRVGMSATTLLIGLFVPLPVAALYPFLGADAFPYVQRAVLPLWMLIAGYLAVRASETISQAVRQKAPQFTESTVFIASVALISAIPIFAGLRDQVAALRSLAAASSEAHALRADLSEQLGDPARFSGGIASDEPGWLMFQRYANIVDLSGRLHPIMLNWISGDGVRSEIGLRDYLASRDVRTAVIWREPRDRFGAVFNCPPRSGPDPAVCRISLSSTP
jgi:hypothetical protein